MGKKILIGLGSIALVLLLVFGYLGFVPFLSSVLGSDKPKDLGVRIGAKDLESAMNKLQLSAVEPAIQDPLGVRLPPVVAVDTSKAKIPGIKKVEPAKLPKQEVDSFPTQLPAVGSDYNPPWGVKVIDVLVSSEEVTSLLNTGKFSTWPISNVQVRVSEDGTGEMTGILSINRGRIFATYTGIPSQLVAQIIEYIPIKTDFPFYIKARGTIINNQVSLDVMHLEIGRLPISTTLIQEYQGEVNQFINNYLIEGRIAKMKGFYAESLVAENGQLRFKGTMPNASPHWYGLDFNEMFVSEE